MVILKSCLTCKQTKVFLGFSPFLLIKYALKRVFLLLLCHDQANALPLSTGLGTKDEVKQLELLVRHICHFSWTQNVASKEFVCWKSFQDQVICKFEGLGFPESLSLSSDKTLKKLWKFEQTRNIPSQNTEKGISQGWPTWGFHKSGLTMTRNDDLVTYHALYVIWKWIR